MASLHLAHSGNISQPSRSRGVLVETLQLVEPRKQEPVPNHLLESKIYSKVALNSVVQAKPAVVHFGGFQLGKTHRAILRIANISSDVQRMHIIPPQTEFFLVKYTKGDRLVPGLTLDCVIEFTPDEWRYYYDSIRIHTPGEENLVIPIHAYPVMNTSDWPQQITFPPVPVGHSSSQIIPLKCHAPIDFEFSLSILQHHPAFTIDPMFGVVPANGEVYVTVVFTPSEFSTAMMTMQLKTSQFNAKPLTCTVTGSSIPGLAKHMTQAMAEGEEGDIIERVMSPLDRARDNKKRKMKKRPGTMTSTVPTMSSEEIEFAGMKFPANLDTPYAVGQVLVQEPGKLRIKDLREAIDAKKGKSAQTRQMKEALFEMAVRQDVYEERQNQLRWQVKLGDDQIKSDLRDEILDNREQAWLQYKRKRGDPSEAKEFIRNCTKCTFRRTRRDCSDKGDTDVKFDTFTNNMWAVRHSALSTFQQAAWKVIVRNRAEKKLKGLRDMLINWAEAGFAQQENPDLQEKEKADKEELELLQQFQLEVPKVTSFAFPTYAPPNVKDDMAVDALGPVPYKPTTVIVKKKIGFQDLKVPQQYRLQGYKPHNVHEASKNYVPATLMRQLRVGAEDELIELDVPVPDVSEGMVDDSKNEDMSKDMSIITSTTQDTKPLPLRAPQAMFKPIEYPHLHIFNPAPGLQVFLPPMPYAETDPDFHLCPLPRYTSSDSTNPHMTTQKQYLDREDVIRGVMGWKRFPSQGLTCLSNTPTLTNVWVPRWTDPFEEDILPMSLPVLQHSLSEQDAENIDEDDNSGVTLTPDMITAQFHLVDDSNVPTDTDQKKKETDMFPYGNRMPPTNIPVGLNGPVAREKREQELEFFMKKKYNKLGNKFYTRTKQLNSLKTNEDLILK